MVESFWRVLDHMLLRTWLRAAILLLTAARAWDTPAEPENLIQLLQEQTAMTGSDLAGLRAGKAIAKVLPEHEKGEIVVAGAIRISVPLQFFLNAFRNLSTLERGRQALIVHEFSDPPEQSDLQSLALAPEDINAMSRCRPGSCSVKLSAEMMEQLRQPESATAAVDQNLTGNLFRSLILHNVAEYLEEGDQAMITYADKRPPVLASEVYLGLLNEFDWLSNYAPPLYECLQSYLGRPCPDVDGFLYWSTAKFGLKPVFAVTHAMIYKTSRQGQPWVFIAFKQIYADHYFEGSLGVAVLVEESAGPGLWGVYINRSRTDSLQGWLAPIKRAIAESKSREAMQTDLTQLKQSVESQYQTGTPAGRPR